MLHKLLALSRIKAPPHPTSSFPSADSRPLQLRRYSAHRGCHLPVKVFGTCLAPCRDSTTAALLPRPGTFLAQHRELPPAGSQPRPLRADGGGSWQRPLAACWAGPGRGGPPPGYLVLGTGSRAPPPAGLHGTARLGTGQLSSGRDGSGLPAPSSGTGVEEGQPSPWARADLFLRVPGRAAASSVPAGRDGARSPRPAQPRNADTGSESWEKSGSSGSGRGR